MRGELGGQKRTAFERRVVAAARYRIANEHQDFKWKIEHDGERTRSRM